MLSFEITDNGASIQIYCDKEGIRTLMGLLEKLQKSEPSHVHLKSPSVGGNELSEHNPWGKAGVSEVVITTGGD